MKSTKPDNQTNIDERENQRKGKSVWHKPSLSFIGKLKEIVRGPGTSPIPDGGSAGYRPEK
jgi:hypothetical protein